MLQGRFKQAMAYPLMIFLVAFVGSVVVGAGLWLIGPTFSQMFDVIFDGGQLPWVTRVVLGPRWLVALAPALLLVPGIILLLLVVMVRRFRSWARWKWPVLREISLWHFASSMALLMEQGMRFEEAVATMEKCERGSAMGRELSRWRTALANGQTNFVGIAFPSDLVPVFFMGLVNAGGGDLAAGFRVAQHVYRELAYCKLDRVLHLLTPVLVLIGFLYVLVPIVAVVWGLFLPLVQLMTCIC